MSYNIAFFADTHIGYSAKVKSNERGVNIRVQDGYDALKEIARQILKQNDIEQIHAVVVGGDLFHTSKPTPRDVLLVQEVLRVIADRGIQIYILAGNHDATDERAQVAAVAPINDPKRGIHALYHPYKAYDLEDGIVLHAVSHHGLKKDEVPSVQAVEGKINIFTTHGAAFDPKNKTLMNCESSPREQIIPVEMIVDENFSMKLLGHYHSRYPVGGEVLNAWYSGSTVRRGFSDAPGARGWLLVKLDDDGRNTVQPFDIKQRPQYDLPPIDANGLTASEVMDKLQVNIETTMDADSAPIVRQKLLNVTSGIRQGLDMDHITELTKHMLYWDLSRKAPERESVLKDGKESRASLERRGGLNLLSSFKDWIKAEAEQVPEEYRDYVVKDAEKYIKEARNANLEKGHSH